jgi:hypothetical protein
MKLRPVEVVHEIVELKFMKNLGFALLKCMKMSKNEWYIMSRTTRSTEGTCSRQLGNRQLVYQAGSLGTEERAGPVQSTLVRGPLM